jgi:hypothetical protein
MMQVGSLPFLSQEQNFYMILGVAARVFLKSQQLNKKTFSGKFGVPPPNQNRRRSQWSVAQQGLFLMRAVCILIFKACKVKLVRSINRCLFRHSFYVPSCERKPAFAGADLLRMKDQICWYLTVHQATLPGFICALAIGESQKSKRSIYVRWLHLLVGGYRSDRFCAHLQQSGEGKTVRLH